MAGLTDRQRQQLTDLFHDRVTFEEVERRMYGHDMAAMPGLVQPLIGNTIPDAVVQPTDIDQLVAVLKWANENRIPLTPRGKASSGYGGAIPVENGVVVDYYFLKDLVSLDTENRTVTVQPGISWEQLDRRLRPNGLTLRLYPTSYPSSTVGGWLSQGGAGFGSYRYGYFADNVVSAKAVLPSGEIRDFRGDDLVLLAGAEGITGFLSEITLRLMPAFEPHVIAIGVAEAEGLQHILEDIEKADLPIWSISFINPRMAELKNEAPVRMHFGHPAETKAPLPSSYVATIYCDAKDREDVEQALGRMLSRHDAARLSDEIARQEYDERFKFMVVKRLGPSLVPSEVVVPLSEFGAAMDDMESVVQQPVVKEGIVARTPGGATEAVILGFIPADERKFNYNLVFGLVLSIMRVAEKHGGRAYSTGLYFGAKAESVLGTDAVHRIREFKEQVDPNGILNPRKVLDNGITGTLLEFAATLEREIRVLGNSITLDLGERPGDPVKGIPGDIAWYAYACTQCGFCVDECDQFYGRGWESESPRGRWYWLRQYMEGKVDWDQRMVDTYMLCTTCELCNFRCSSALPIEPSWMKLRGKLINDERKMTFPAFEVMSTALDGQGDIWAKYRKDRADWFPKDLLEKHGPGVSAPNLYFAGCTASFVEHDIGIASVRILDEAGVDFTYLGTQELCCSIPMLCAGKWDQFAEIMRTNIANVKATGAGTVVTSCPGCDVAWRHYYPLWAERLGIDFGLTVKHYSEILADMIRAGEFQIPESVEADPAKGRKERVNGRDKVKVTWHDSCHIGRASGVYEPPRELIRANPNADFVEFQLNREEAHCCANVITLIKEPTAAQVIGGERLREAQAVGAETILSACPCCEFQLRVAGKAVGSELKVVDLARFTGEALGYDFPAPEPEVERQWATFDAMIRLMTPGGFADVMREMLPELVDAMPLEMGSVMRGMAHVPGALAALKPTFPILFPQLMPGMMPKVMPRMLELVKKRVPMPDYMAEQMPELLPKAMENLLPHMLPEVVPLIADDLIAYLEGEGADRRED